VSYISSRQFNNATCRFYYELLLTLSFLKEINTEINPQRVTLPLKIMP
jgi:hypothetical protein